MRWVHACKQSVWCRSCLLECMRGCLTLYCGCRARQVPKSLSLPGRHLQVILKVQACHQATKLLLSPLQGARGLHTHLPTLLQGAKSIPPRGTMVSSNMALPRVTMASSSTALPHPGTPSMAPHPQATTLLEALRSPMAMPKLVVRSRTGGSPWTGCCSAWASC